MQPLPLPSRLYFFSDVYGDSNSNPTKNTSIEECISTDFRCALLHAHSVKREFDIHYQPQCTDHILRSIIGLYDEQLERPDLNGDQKQQFAKEVTGIFINIAPRISTKNGETPFVLATARNGSIRIVTTGFAVLSAIKDEIETLEYLPNPAPHTSDAPYTINAEHNGLYDWREQFRSSYTPQLLDPNHSYSLVTVDNDHIPDYTKQWHIAYIDRYGNVITWSPDIATTMAAITTAMQGTQAIKLMIGETAIDLPVETPESLGSATPGAYIVYKNGNNIDITRKWLATDSVHDRINKSGYYALGKPLVGSNVRI